MFMERMTREAGDPLSGEISLAPQIWPAIVNAMMAEVRSGATEEQACGFFRALGGRIAATLEVGDIDHIDTLCDHINRFWMQLGWGHVAMALNEDGITLCHDHVPPLPSVEDKEPWFAAAGSMLEGAYDAWFRALGSSNSFRTYIIHQAEGRFEIRHAP